MSNFTSEYHKHTNIEYNYDSCICLDFRDILLNDFLTQHHYNTHLADNVTNSYTMNNHTFKVDAYRNIAEVASSYRETERTIENKMILENAFFPTSTLSKRNFAVFSFNKITTNGYVLAIRDNLMYVSACYIDNATNKTTFATLSSYYTNDVVCILLFKDNIAVANGASIDSITNLGYWHHSLLYLDNKKTKFEGIKMIDLGYPNYDDYELIDKSSANLGGTNNKGGYNGGFDDSCDTISLPTTPSIGISNNGLLNVYKIGGATVNNLINEIFPRPDAGNDVFEAINNLVDTFQNSNLVSFIKGCHIIPVSANTSQTENIKVGYKSCITQGFKVNNDYVDVEVGSLSLSEYYGSFLDYVGCSCQLFLPFFGYVDIEPELVFNGKITVIYRFNIIDGSFVIFIKSTSGHSKLTDSIVAQYTGNCIVNIPVTSVEGSSFVKSLVNGSIQTISSGVGGNVGGTFSGIGEILSAKPTVNGSNSYNSSNSFLGLRQCFIKISRVVSNTPKELSKIKGLESNIFSFVRDCSGYTKFSAVEWETENNIPQNELNEIETLLLSGVYL